MTAGDCTANDSIMTSKGNSSWRRTTITTNVTGAGGKPGTRKREFERRAGRSQLRREVSAAVSVEYRVTFAV